MLVDLLEAEVFLEETRGGASEPVMFTCRDASGSSVDVVVKFSCAVCEPPALARDLVGCLLAAALRLPVGRPVLVQISDALIEAIRGVAPLVAMRAQTSVQPMFGSVHLGPGYQLCSREMVTSSLRQRAGEVWAFDQLTMNADRNALKPNCLTDGTDIAAIDHEKALNVYGVGGFIPAPWQEHWQPSRGHLFADIALQGMQLDRLESAWSQLDEPFFDQLIESVPATWAANEAMAAAHAYLVDLRKNLSQAFSNLRKVLI